MYNVEITAIFDWANRANVLLLGLVTFFVWRLYTNHLPHLEASMNSLHEEIGRLRERVVRLETKVNGGYHPDNKGAR